MGKIIVFGATGMIGEKITQELISAGNDVTIGARNTIAAQSKFPGRSIKKVDVLDPLTVLPAIEGQEIVCICLSPDRTASKKDPMSEREGIENILSASKKMNIKRVILVSSLVQGYQGMNNFNWWIFDLKLEAVKKLKESGIPYTILYPSCIMETIPRDIIRGNRILLVAGSVAKMWFVSATDLGKQIARAIEIAGDTNQEYAVQGLNGYDWEEVALKIKQYYKSDLKIARLPVFVLKFAGIFNRTANYGAHICEALNKYPEQFESEKTFRDLGKPSISLEEYLTNLRID